MAYTITGQSSSLYCFKLGEVTNLKPLTLAVAMDIRYLFNVSNNKTKLLFSGILYVQWILAMFGCREPDSKKTLSQHFL